MSISYCTTKPTSRQWLENCAYKSWLLYILNQSMKFETRSGCKLLSIFLCDEREYFELSLSSFHNRSVDAVTRIRLNAMSGPIKKLMGPAKTWLQLYVEEASSLPSSAVEEKTVTEDELRVEEVIARINTNVSLLERCNR